MVEASLAACRGIVRKRSDIMEFRTGQYPPQILLAVTANLLTPKAVNLEAQEQSKMDRFQGNINIKGYNVQLNNDIAACNRGFTS